ncbi:thiolase family protein [Phenylobacterium conjunctum]|uniref:Thiolase family protein n=1 Tax=Phenylobacterium conjunctum TaxID=1298959 RepID=A0ABW3T0Z3_9CAUL
MSKSDIFIAGVGMTPFGLHKHASMAALSRAAVSEALTDAGCDATGVEGVWFSNACQGILEGQHLIRGQVALRPVGFEGVPIINVENACASATTALHGAINHLRAGAADIVLAVGAEKMTHPDRARSFSVFDAGWDVADPEANRRALVALGGMDEEQLPPPADRRSVFMDVYAAFGRQHMRLYGSTARQFAAVAAKNHGHSVANPRAQFRQSFSVEEVLAARGIAWPLTLPMCAPISDGAAAAVVCTERGLRKLGAQARAVRVRACVLGSSLNRAPDDLRQHLGCVTARKAYEAASLGPADIDVAEVHDATAVGEVIQVENLGLAPFGEGGVAALSGETAIGGRIPVNPSGGLESKGHPIGATGLGQIYELVAQLRGEAESRQVAGAHTAIAENGGGLWGVEEAVCAITILSK